jgi:hypothetical protein
MMPNNSGMRGKAVASEAFQLSVNGAAGFNSFTAKTDVAFHGVHLWFLTDTGVYVSNVTPSLFFFATWKIKCAGQDEEPAVGGC